MPFVSFIVGYRNREIDRIKFFLESLNCQIDKDFELVFVNYGSDKNFSQEAEKLVAEYSFARYYLLNTAGQTWNRAKCLNYASSKSCGEYIFTSDIDFLFDQSFINLLKKVATEKQALYFKVGFLTQKQSTNLNINSNKYKTEGYSDKNAIGAMLISRKMFYELDGYDEFYEIWGLEDNDFFERIRKSQFNIRFFDEAIYIWHLWHLPVKKSDVLPAGWLKLLGDYFNYKHSNPVRSFINFHCNFDRSRPLINEKEKLKIHKHMVHYNNEFLYFFLKNELLKITSSEVLEITFNFNEYNSVVTSRLNKIILRINTIFSTLKLPLLLVNTNMNSYINEKEARKTIIYFIKNNLELINDYFLPENLTKERFYLMKK